MTDGLRPRDLRDHNAALYRLSYGHHGGDDRSRTDDNPACKAGALASELRPQDVDEVVDVVGLEPTACDLRGSCSTN